MLLYIERAGALRSKSNPACIAHHLDAPKEAEIYLALYPHRPTPIMHEGYIAQ
jgi:hypothetical protein